MTRTGWGCILFTFLALFAAATSGNNLIYLLYSGLVAILFLSWLIGHLNLRHLEITVDPPDQIFRGSDFLLGVRVRNRGKLPVFGVQVAAGGRHSVPVWIEPGHEQEVKIPYNLPHRGMNRLDNLLLQSAFPFGFIQQSRRVPAVFLTAFPRLREIRSRAELSVDIGETGVASFQKGVGDELVGIREKQPGDDSRLINWKLLARTGKPLVNEYAGVVGSKVTIRLPGMGEGEEAEHRIEEAASACRFYIDGGAEVQLVTPEVEVSHGKGLLHLEKLLQVLAWYGEGRRPRSVAFHQGAVSMDPLSLAEEKDLRRLTFAGVCIAYAVLFLVEDISPWFLLAFVPVFPLGWMIQERGGPWLPDGFWNAISVGVLFYVLGVDWRLNGVTVANTHLLTYMLINRSLNPLTFRSLGHMFVICFLTFFIASAQTISLWYILFFLLYMVFSCVWLCARAGLPLRRPGVWVTPLAGLLVVCLLISAAFFTVTPRVRPITGLNPLAAMGLVKLVPKSSTMGFTEDVSLGFFGELKRSHARVLRIKPMRELPDGARPDPLLVRGAVLDFFDGKRWSKARQDFYYRNVNRLYRTIDGRAWISNAGSRLALPGNPAAKTVRTYDMTLSPTMSAVLFTVGSPRAIEGVGNAVYFDYTDSLYMTTSSGAGLHYLLYTGLGRIGFSQSFRNYPIFLKERFLQLPVKLDPRVQALAQRATRKVKDPLSKAKAVESYLNRVFRYATDASVGRESLDDFLFKTHRGNCEYFASAAVLLLRSLGIPARLVAGYLAKDWNEYGKFYDVRQDQAHAWAEAYIPEMGWVTIDATPGEKAFPLAATAFFARMGRYLDAVQQGWYRDILGYDYGLQRDTFRRLGLGISREALTHGLSRVGMGLGAGLILWMGRWLFFEVRRRLREPRKGPFAQAQRMLEKAGLLRENWLTPREYALQVSLQRPELEAILVLAELHYLNRYSSEGLSARQNTDANLALESLHFQLSGTAGV